MVTVTGVDVTRDLRHAKVFVSVLGEEAERTDTMAGLAGIASHLRGHIGRALRLRSAPELTFKYDQSVTHAARIETLLERVRQEREGGPDDAADDPRATVSLPDGAPTGPDAAARAPRPTSRAGQGRRPRRPDAGRAGASRRAPRAVSVSGLLLVDKPAGVTSHDVVNAARRALGEKRIGHAGTLDPFATGLLVLLVGQATRLVPHVSGDPKVYAATVRFGAETDTEDLAGAVIRDAPAPTEAAVRAALPTLTGDLDQTPPAYSAKRVQGRRAYDLARAGEEVALAPARVRVDTWEVLDWRDGLPAECDVRVTCGPGTYVRSLARDLGRLTGSAAHLSALRRERSGRFDVRDAVTLDALRDGGVTARPALDALPEHPTQALDPVDVRRAAGGNLVAATIAGEWASLVDAATGTLVALAERRAESWQPRVVLNG
jgi:tRNA pseudouridine55 synthase